MKTKEEIEVQLSEIEWFLELSEKKYAKLHPIDMLSGQGVALQKGIHELNGMIIAFKWILGSAILILPAKEN